MAAEAPQERPPATPWTRAAGLARELAFEPLAPRRQRWAYAAVAALVAAAWAAHAAKLGRPVFPVDDAYITLHNALALRAGRDVNFPGASPLQGATSAVHLLLVALLTVALPPLWALHTAAWLGALAYALGLLRMAFVHRATAAQAALLVAVGVVAGRTPHQLMNGLETGLAMAGTVWALNFAADPRRRGAAAVTFGVLPFLRPELAALAFPSVAVLAAGAWRDAPSRRAGALGALRVGALALAGAAPWMAWYLAGTGALWPATVAAKRAFFSEGCLAPAVKEAWVRDSLREFARHLGVLTRALAFALLTPLGWAGLVFAAALTYAYYRQFPGALNHYENRYLYVLLPVMLYAAASTFGRRSAFLRGAGAAVLLLALEQSLWDARERWQQHLNNRAFTAVELDGVAAWCRANLPPNARLLIHDAGYISFATRLQMVDLVGLKTRASMDRHLALTWRTCGAGRAEAVHQIALAARPDHLVVLRGWDGIYRITEGLRARGWELTSLRPPGAVYEVYRLTPPPTPPPAAPPAPAAP